jgi:hypothetical protein
MTSSSTPPGWWAKVQRGQEHRHALDRYITETLALEINLPSLAVKFDADTLEHVIYVKRIPNLDEFHSRVSFMRWERSMPQAKADSIVPSESSSPLVQDIRLSLAI